MSDDVRRDIMAEILTLAAASVGDSLAASGLDSNDFAFTLVLWPIGSPDRVSTICGSGDPCGQKESTLALAKASVKAKHPPSHTLLHKSHGPGRLN